MRRCKATIWENRAKVPVEGLFHQWAQQFEDCGDAGVGNYTVALIELEDGRIVEALPDTVVFLDRVPGIETGGTRRQGGSFRFTELRVYCMNCGRPCKKAYPYSTVACPDWISQEGLFSLAPGTET